MIGVYAIAWGCVLFNFACVFINLAPNKRLLDYGLGEQVVDALPTLLIALTMGAVVYWIQWLEIPNMLILAVQLVMGIAVYVCLSKLFKEESFMYLIQMIKEYKRQNK